MRLFARWPAVIICAVVLIAGAVVWWRLSTGDDAPPPRAQEQLEYFNVPTSGWQVGSVGQQAGLPGTLRFTEDDCPFVDAGGELRVSVVMPAGARGVIVDGVRSIVDPSGLVYGTEGEQVRWGGGAEGGGTKGCAGTGEGRFSVQVAPTTRRIDGTTVEPEPPTENLGDPPCQRSDDPPDDVEHFDVTAVANKFDSALRNYTSYAGAQWHDGGGVRVRIATTHADYDAARAEAERIIADLPAAYRHAVKINEVTASLDDVRRWAAAAEDGLTYVPAKNIVGTSTDELCLYVDVHVKAYSAVRLTDQESERYKLGGFQLTPQ